MTNTRFKKRLKEYDELINQLKYDKEEFKYDVIRFMKSRGIPVRINFFGDTFGVDIHITKQDCSSESEVPLKIPLNVLMDFCNEFGCEYEHTIDSLGKRYIFSFNGLDMGF